MPSPDEKEAWTLDQLAKSEFFHQKLHEFGMLEIAYQIESIRGEELTWDREELAISESAWNKIIHRGIRPVVVFAHPYVLMDIPGALAYYRMLSMVSQKSMKRVGMSGDSYEQGRPLSELEEALAFARHLNTIISLLVEADEKVDPREFDLWRGMAAGSQAQGVWQNVKGDRAEVLVKGQLKSRLRSSGRIIGENESGSRVLLTDGRQVAFGDEPDIAFYDQEGNILIAIEVKGGIDTAGVLERIGAALKSLSRAKEENPDVVTILILQGVSLSDQAVSDLETNRRVIDYWFTIEDMRDSEEQRGEVFDLLGV